MNPKVYAAPYLKRIRNKILKLWDHGYTMPEIAEKLRRAGFVAQDGRDPDTALVRSQIERMRKMGLIKPRNKKFSEAERERVFFAINNYRAAGLSMSDIARAIAYDGIRTPNGKTPDGRFVYNQIFRMRRRWLR